MNIHCIIECPDVQHSTSNPAATVPYLLGLYHLGNTFRYWSQSQGKWMDIGDDAPVDNDHANLLKSLNKEDTMHSHTSLRALLNATYWMSVGGKLEYMSTQCTSHSEWHAVLHACSEVCLEAAKEWVRLWSETGSYRLLDRKDAWRMEQMEQPGVYMSHRVDWKTTQRSILYAAKHHMADMPSVKAVPKEDSNGA